MKTLFYSLKIISAVALLALFAGCSTTKRTENMLTLAGFKVVADTTPAQERKVNSLPPGKVSLAHSKGKTYYVFPDPTHHQIYVGRKLEYENYQEILLNHQIAGQDRVNGEMAFADGDDWSDGPDLSVIVWN